MRTKEDCLRQKVSEPMLDLIEEKRFVIKGSRGHQVTLETQFNRAAKRDYMARLLVDGEEVCYIDRDELIMYLQTE